MVKRSMGCLVHGRNRAETPNYGRVSEFHSIIPDPLGHLCAREAFVLLKLVQGSVAGSSGL